ncbi:MAG: hypothetical protein H0W72_17155, partial [Planctomycetes bacterium]|nr:hypothetical protein [Planctomycetota bacterium]
LAEFDNRAAARTAARLEEGGHYHITPDGAAYRLDFPGGLASADATAARNAALLAMRTDTQAAYDAAIPDYCLYASKLRVIDAGVYDALQALDPALLAGPVRTILANGETERMPAACQLVWIAGGLPCGADLVRFARGTERALLPDGGYLNALFIELGAALAVVAETDAQTRGYLDEVLRQGAWKTGAFTFAGSSGPAGDYLVSTLANGLAYAPSDRSVELLRAASADFPYSANRIALIEAFRASGTSVQAYRREIFFEGKMTNAFVSLAPPPATGVPSTGARVEQLGSGPASGSAARHGHGDHTHAHLSPAEAAAERERLIRELAARPEQAAQWINEIGQIDGDQILAALPAVTAHLRAHPDDRGAADSLLVAMRRVDAIIPSAQLDELVALASATGVREASLTLLKAKQAALVDEARPSE